MRALDLFCGGGGACLGMLDAGFDEVVGIDIKARPHYPGTFIQADIHSLPVDIRTFDFIWASPPCQKYSIATKMAGRDINSYPDLVPVTREILDGLPYTCIENVPFAPIRPDVVLVGPNVGLNRIARRRHFELSFFMLYPGPVPLPAGIWERGEAITITKSMSATSHYYTRKANGYRGRVSNAEAKQVMGIPDDIRMTNAEIGEAVPPPYAEFIARQALTLIRKDKSKP